MSRWRQVEQMLPRVDERWAAAGHVTRWAPFLGVALYTTLVFTGPLHGGIGRGLESIFGRLLLNSLIVAVFGITLVIFRPKLYASVRAVAFFGLAFGAILAVAAFVGHAEVPQPAYIPIAIPAVLCTVLFDTRISVFGAVVTALLIGVQAPYAGTPALVIVLAGGVAAAFSVRVIRRRDQAYRSILVTAAAYAVAELAAGMLMGDSVREIWHGIEIGAANSVFSVALALMLLPPLEAFTGVDTYLRLLEWSDLNRPLMQRLSIEAPGTFAHTMRLANLVEAASNAIGANGLLARCGAYYHDIGKLAQPEYFVENQRPGLNPHDALPPAESAAIIRDHVRQGGQLTEEHSVPDTVRAFVAEHHGTTQITYFLEKAKARGGMPANLAEFAYPGPIPQTAETAICMLADGVEASTHVLHDPTPKTIRDVIEYIVHQRIAQGQLREAPLTLRQIEVVKEQFARVLIGMYHHRVDYPRTSGSLNATAVVEETPEGVEREPAVSVP